MARIEILKTLVNERLTAAAEEIFGIFERTIIRYEEEIDRQRKLVALVLKPDINLRRADNLQLLVCEEEVLPEQQQRSLSLGQEDPEPPQIKEEEEELWTCQDGEQLQGRGLEEADFNIPFTPVPVRRENEEDKSQSTQTQIEEDGEGDPLPGISTEEMKTEPHVEPDSYYQASDLPSTSTEQMKTEPEGEYCGVSEPASNSDTEPFPDGQLLSSDCYQTETEDSGTWKETREPQSGLYRWTSKRMHKVKGQRLSISNNFATSGQSSPGLKSSDQTAASHCQVCRKSFTNRRSFLCHVKVHTRGCGLCGKHLEPTESLKLHIHSHKKCYICGKEFPSFAKLERHERSHTGEKPFSCTVCGKGFSQYEHLQIHLRIHTGEKPFHCTVCGKRFNEKGTVKIHMRIHTGAKPYSCGLCGERFRHLSRLRKHSCRTGE